MRLGSNSSNSASDIVGKMLLSLVLFMMFDVYL